MITPMGPTEAAQLLHAPDASTLPPNYRRALQTIAQATTYYAINTRSETYDDWTEHTTKYTNESDAIRKGQQLNRLWGVHWKVTTHHIISGTDQ